jgi:hypothetical protein
MSNRKSILSDWSVRELKALDNGLKYLNAKQTKTKKSHKVQTGVKGCHYSVAHGCYIINILKGNKKIYCGRMREWNKAKAVAMQAQGEAKWIEEQKTTSQETV